DGLRFKRPPTPSIEFGRFNRQKWWERSRGKHNEPWNFRPSANLGGNQRRCTLRYRNNRPAGIGESVCVRTQDQTSNHSKGFPPEEDDCASFFECLGSLPSPEKRLRWDS